MGQSIALQSGSVCHDSVCFGANAVTESRKLFVILVVSLFAVHPSRRVACNGYYYLYA
jgi:hypothetical protein